MGIRACRRAALAAIAALAVVAFAATPASADIAPKWSVDQLTDFSEVIVTGHIVSVAYGYDEAVATPYTYVTLDIADVLKGSVPVRRIVLKQIGGEAGAETLHIQGQSMFQAGENVVVFLEVRPRDNTLYTTALWQGKWNLGEDEVSRQQVVTRRQFGLSNSLEWFLLERFTERVRTRARAVAAAGSTIQWVPREAPAVREGFSASPYTLMGPARWNEADTSGAIPIDIQAGGQPGLAGGGQNEVWASAAQWNNVGTAFRWSAGSAASSGSCTTMWPNARTEITHMDPCGEISNSGGTLAIGGFYSTESGGKTINGQAFNRITRGGIVNNDSATALNYLQSSGCYAAIELHELGHVLGLGHSADASALMYPYINNGCFSSTINLAADDRAGLAFIYPGGGAGAPNPPTNLLANVVGTTVNLNWTASAALMILPAGAPTTYIIEAGSASGLADLANFSTGNTSTGYSAAGVPPGTYFIRVKASNASGTSAASNQVTATVGSGGGTAPGAPTNLTGSGPGGGNVTLNWSAPTTGGAPTSYVIQAGSVSGASDLANLPTGTTATAFASGGVPPGRYYVRILATNAAGTSGPSNEITLIVQ